MLPALCRLLAMVVALGATLRAMAAKNGAVISHEMHMTMIDGKVSNTIADVPSSATCPICLAKPSEMNNLGLLDTKPVREDVYKHGLSSLHMKIRCMECLLHISYNMDFERWSARGPFKRLKEAKKAATQKEFREVTGLVIDVVKQGFGTTNDGNTARRFFRDYEKSSQITGIDKNLILRFSVILQAISCGRRIDISKFKLYCRETAELYVTLYEWYYMPASVHKLLMHGAEICRNFSVLPIVPMTHVTAVAGEPVYLPCDISQEDDDAVLLVLWYREDLGTPIYSVDARDRDFGIAERWSDESVFAARAYFLPQRKPAELAVDRVKGSDQGIYRCRVDFKQAQTRNSRVNLTVIVPPNKMVITDDRGDVKEAIVGPYVEGDTFSLKCDVMGGRPRSWVKWYRDEIEQDTPATPLQGNSVRGVIRVGPLTRADVRATLTCRASNHARAHPIETTLTLDMNFPPLTVHILGSNQPLSASRRYDLLCQSSGSRPPASITWWKNGHRMNNSKETLSTDGNTTTSTISLQLSKSDAGAKLACRASNPQMPSTPALEDDWILDIQYVPETTVRLGTNLDPKNIREGSDVYFDCIIKAHPYVYKVEWRHNGKTLTHNVGHGVIISNQSLVLQGVGRRTAGNYTCVGFNAEGDGESKPFSLNVLYAPTCRNLQQRVHGVAKQEKAHITCHVDANPPEVTFRWTFNNTANSNEVSDTYVSRAGTSSTVTYTPHTEMDYGTLLCWAHNKIGKQRVPCVYHIIAAGRPDQVHNCSVVNASLSSFGIRCSEGFNGGMPQSFLLEVREIMSQEIVANVSSAVPRFMALGLAPGRTYAAAVLAYNAKGRGDPYLLRASTLRPPEKHHVHDKSLDLPRTAFQMSGAMSAAVGAGGVLMVVLVLIMIAMRQKCAKRKPRSAPPPSSQPASPDKLREKDDSESDDRNPDIIPSDTDQMQIDYYRQQQVSTISPPLGSRGPRGSVAGVRGGLPGYCPLRTAPPPSHPTSYEASNASSGIPPPARFAAGSCTLPRGSTITAPGDTRCGIPMQHLRTLPRPLPAPAPAPRLIPRDTPL